jgi:predicted nucleotidyltransferase component of viral defense system
MAKEILTKNQQKILTAVGQDKWLNSRFYLTGGTALAAFYLKHRYSEDLDFFSAEEFEVAGISVFFKKQQKKLGLKKIAYEQSFNRNLFFLYIKDKVIKIEFTYFPFPRIQQLKAKDRISVDSLLDIAVNKLFTIYQKPRSRDYIDLYLIVKKENWSIGSLIKKAKIKFDWHVDPVQLGSQFRQAKFLKDYPRMIIKINHKIWENFFLEEAKKIGKDILE